MAAAIPSTLDRLLDSFANCLTPEVARKVAALRADAATQTQLDDFARRANRGELTPRERAEYESMIEAIDIISILQAKARATLADKGEPWTPPSDD